MKPGRLVEMANDIAAYFEAEPDHAAAVEGIVLHLQRFWEPGMRSRIVRHLREGHGDVLEPLAREAVAELARRLEETPPPPVPQGGGDAG